MKKDTIIKIASILISIVVLGIIILIVHPRTDHNTDSLKNYNDSGNPTNIDSRKISDNLYCDNQLFEDEYYKDRVDTETMQNYCNAISEYLDNKFPNYSFYMDSVDLVGSRRVSLYQVLDNTVPVYKKPYNAYILNTFYLYIEDNNVEEKYKTIDISEFVDPTITIPNNIISNKSAIRKAKNYLVLHPYYSDRLIPASNTQATLIYEMIEGKFVYVVNIKGSADTVYMDAVSGEVLRTSRSEWQD